MYSNMQQWQSIRRRVLVEGVSKRQILRETGMHWTTLEKILAYCMEQDHPQAGTFSLAGREHLAGITVAPPQLESYRALMRQEVAV